MIWLFWQTFKSQATASVMTKTEKANRDKKNKKIKKKGLRAYWVPKPSSGEGRNWVGLDKKWIVCIFSQRNPK